MKVIHVGQLTAAKIAGFESAGLQVRDGGTNCSIGIQYLRRFVATLDLGRRKIYLKKGAKFDVPDKDPAVNIGILEKNNRKVGSFVGRNSRAERTGIQISDELISVGGSVRGKPHAEIRRMYREKADANGHLMLVTRRGGIERNVDVEINE